jgi:hypothetical protein
MAPPPARIGDGNSAISGVVTDAITGRPLAGALVTLGMDVRANGQALRPPPVGRQATDDKGRFVFRYLPASDAYFLNASMLGYADGGYGKTPGSNVALHVVLTPGQWFSRANIELWKPGAITGRVLDEHGDPVVGVFVRVLRKLLVAGRPQLAAGIVTTTDDRGVYRLAGLSPGTYLVHVPSVQMAFPASTPIDTLAPPIPGSTAAQPVPPPAIDADAGNRLVVGSFMTPPPGGGRPLTYPGTFYPGATVAAQATSVEVPFGRDAENIDFQIAPVPGFRVSGVVEGPPDVVQKLTLRLLPAGSEDLAQGAEAATALVGPRGAFTFLNVPAGEYVIDARGSLAQYEIDGGLARYAWPKPPGSTNTGGSAGNVASGPPGTGLTTARSGFGEAYWGRQPLTVGDRDLGDVAVPLHRTVTFSGRLVWENTASTPPPAQHPRAILEPANGSASLGQPTTWLSFLSSDPDAFMMEGLMPGEYLFRLLGLGDGWAVKTITSGGRDVTSTPFDGSAGRDFTDVVVTLTDRATTLSGSVQPADAAAPTGAAVLAFPADRAHWSNYGFTPTSIKSTRLTNAGTFRIANLPAGDYLIVAVEDSLADAWQDPKFLEAAAPLATRVSMGWGESKSVDLRVVQVRVK